ncbi:MAG TPA: 2-dehydropantoate 2-reductase [Streptosporangiaceae bacterium]|nr:2-dehydropantoate 2-reductase [Streptosporangiaceae bacterium]
MRVAVLGAGAIGGYVGACLARAGLDVTLIARGAHLAVMRERGLRVLGPDGGFQVTPRVTGEIAAVSGADVVFLGLKAYSLPQVAPALGGALRPGTTVIAAQNGIPWWYFQGGPGPYRDLVIESVDPGGAVTAAVPPASVVGCVVYPATEIAEPGVIRHIEGNRFSLGEPDGSRSARCGEISRALQAAGLRAPVATDLRSQIWLKVVGNAALNPVTALLGVTLGQLGRSPAAMRLVRAVMTECAAVASALGIELPITVDRRLAAAIEVGDHRTSMLQDRLAGKPLETGCLTGAVIEIAGRAGVGVPQTRAVHDLITAAEDLGPAAPCS